MASGDNLDDRGHVRLVRLSAWMSTLSQEGPAWEDLGWVAGRQPRAGDMAVNDVGPAL